MVFAQVLFLTPVRQRGSASLKVQVFLGGGGFNHVNPLLTIPAYAIGRRFIRPSEIPPTISTNLEMQGNFLTF